MRCSKSTARCLAGVAVLLLINSAAAGAASDPPQAVPPASDQSASSAPDPPARAEDGAQPQPAPPPPEVSGLRGFFMQTGVTAFVDAYYSFSGNGTAPVELRNFDVTHNQLRFSGAELALEKKAAASSRVGFRLDLTGGPAADMVNAAEPGGADHWKALQQAYVSYLVPLGSGLTVDAGKFVTPLGAEVIEARDNWNYSRSVLFTAAVPYYHFGARIAYPVTGKITLTGLVVNGWNNVTDNNDSPTVGVSASFAPTSRLTLVQNVMVGQEQPSGEEGVRRVFNTVATVTATSTLSFMGDLVVGRDSTGGVAQRWHGVAGYARLQPAAWFALSPRVEWYSDPDGFTTGLPQTIRELTLTGELKALGLIARMEVRHDRSSQPFFSTEDGRLGRSRTTFTVGLIYAISQPGR